MLLIRNQCITFYGASVSNFILGFLFCFVFCFILFLQSVNKRCVYSFFLNTVLVMCIRTVSSKGKLELVGLRRRRSPLFCHLRCVTQAQRVVRERVGSTCSSVFVNGGCVLLVDAGTRVHLLDAEGLSFT